MTAHEQYQNDLKAYIDNELPLLRRLAMRRHVDGCRACREELMQMAQVTEELRADEATESASTGIDSALRARIIEGVPPTADAQRTREPLSRKLVTAGALASIVIAAGVVGHSKLPPPEPTAAQAKRVKAYVASMQGVPQAPPPSHAPKHFNEPVELAWSDYNGVTAGDELTKPQSKSHNVYHSTNTNATGTVTDATLYATDSATNTVALSSSTPPQITSLGAPQSYSFTTDGYSGANTDTDLERRVHREASVTVDVDNPEAKSDDIETRVKSMGGYVASSSLSTGDDGRKTAEMNVKVPVVQFDTFMAEVAHLGTLTGKDVTSEDITDKVSDAQVREGVLEGEVGKAESRLKILGRRSKWADAETARDLRIQLGQARARLVILKKLGELADIDITLTQKTKADPPPATGFASGLGNASKTAFESLTKEVGTIFAGLIWIVVFAPIWLPAGLLLRWLYRRYRTVDNQMSS